MALMAAGIRQPWWTAPWWWLYGIAVLTGTVWVYVCLLWMGLAPVQVWDTVALIGAFYALFILQQLTQSTPLLHMVLLLPLLAMATAPLQLASVHTSGAFLTVAMLYLGIRQSTGKAFPLYMGLLTLNVGIYLWVPGWAHAYHLLQIYTIPAAVSVLWLLHAHRHELQPTVLHSLRLAASSILYVSATAVKKEKGITRRCIALSRWLQGGASMYNTGSDLYSPFSWGKPCSWLYKRPISFSNSLQGRTTASSSSEDAAFVRKSSLGGPLAPNLACPNRSPPILECHSP